MSKFGVDPSVSTNVALHWRILAILSLVLGRRPPDPQEGQHATHRLVSCSAPITQKARKGLVNRVARTYPHAAYSAAHESTTRLTRPFLAFCVVGAGHKTTHH